MPTDDDDLFEIVVEQQGNATAFEVPDGFRYDQHTVGDLDVQVVIPPRGATSKPRAPIVTFHDVGMNAPLCFSAFFSYCRTSGACPELDTAAAHYHITAPGHFPNAPALPNAPYGVNELAAGVLQVLERFQLRRSIGFGFGIGCTVLTQAALNDTNAFGGLVMVSPLFYSASLWERTFTSADAIYTQGLGLGRRAKDRFLERWLSVNARDYNHDLVQHIEDELDRLAPSNLAAFLSAEASRPDLSAKMKELQMRVLLVTGRDSPLRYHVDDAFPNFNPSKVTWLDVMDQGSFVLEETPDRVAKALALYLQGFGTYE